MNENILSLKEIVSKKFNVDILNINIFLEYENSSFNLQQIYNIYGYKYTLNSGTINHYSLPDKIGLLDLFHAKYNHLRICI
jgi:hypothetical protein